MSPRAATARAGALAAGVLVLDQITKAVVRSALAPGEDVDLVLGISLTNVRNSGIAFGLLSGGGRVLTIVILAALAALAVVVAFFAVNARRRFAWVPTGLLLGGALGNLVDRVFAGAVTDFIDFPAWPAFNVADIAITFGVVSLVFVLDHHDRPARAG